MSFILGLIHKHVPKKIQFCLLQYYQKQDSSKYRFNSAHTHKCPPVPSLGQEPLFTSLHSMISHACTAYPVFIHIFLNTSVISLLSLI